MQFNMQSKKVAIIFWIIIGIILFFFHFRGLSIHDGGYIVHSAQRMLKGEMIYRDFDFVYTPLSVLLTTSLFKIFGQSIFIERLFALLLSLTTVFLLYRLLKLFTSNSLFLTSSLLLYLCWGPTHINFISPVMLSITTGLCTLLLLLKALFEKNKQYLLYAGLTTGITFLWKQNFGIMLFITGLCFFLFNPIFRKRSYFFKYLIGSIIPLFFLFIFLILTGSYMGYLNNLWFYTIQNIIIEQKLTTQFFYGNTLFQKVVKAAFYLTPVWISAMAGLVMLKHNKKYLFLPIWIILYYFVSIRPETDFIHLVPILSLVGIPLLFIIQCKYKYIKLFGILTSIGLIILGFYSSLFMGYYRWENPLIKNVVWNSTPRINIWTDDRWQTISEELTKTLNQFSNSNDYLYINANTPLLYFISNRKNPTRFDFVFPYAEKKQYQEEIIKDLNSKKVRLAMTEKSDQFNTLVLQYILVEYQPIKEIDKFVLWKKKPTIKEF